MANDKTCSEQEFKFFVTHKDALENSNYFLETIEYESYPPEFITSKIMKESFRLKIFQRQIDGATFLETIYLKT